MGVSFNRRIGMDVELPLAVAVVGVDGEGNDVVEVLLEPKVLGQRLVTVL